MYRYWFRLYENGVLVSEGVSAKTYTRKGNATRAAKSFFRDHDQFHYEWIVSVDNPWKGAGND